MTLPQQFIDYVSQYPLLQDLPTALATEPSVSIRLNPAKGGIPVPPGAVPVAWCPGGYHLPERPKFTLDPRLHQGLYYVQDASSMAITAAIRQLGLKAPVKYLDACAAPGGKTTAAISALPQGSLVVANEFDPKRAEILAENLAKWGSPYDVATKGDTSRLRGLPGFFDVIAVDAPCSGEGMMRKDPEAARQWSPALVKSCAALQREILANAWEALVPGGHLIYSTCTFNTSENEENVRWLISELDAMPLHIAELDAIATIAGPITSVDNIDTFENIDNSRKLSKILDADIPCYRFIPGRVQGEGLFMALLQKPFDARQIITAASADTPLSQKIKATGKGKKKGQGGDAAKMPSEIASWLDASIQWKYIQKDTEIFAIPLTQAQNINLLSTHLHLMAPGLHIATLKGHDLIPTQELALSTALNYKHCPFSACELTLEQAIAYLQRQSITLPPEAPRGIILLSYENRPLGFAKNLGTRANNLYPKYWRIHNL